MAFRECTTAEKDIGMLYYLSGADGTGGRLKARAEDFVVEEVSKGPERAENGKYTIATVKATNWESNRMIRLFAREMGMSRERIGFAGTKDKRAVTTQLMSFECPPSQLEKVQLKDVEFSDVYTARRNIRIGDLVGNRFRIRVTGCSRPADEIASIVGEVAADIKANKGFPNYFGVQRFGVMRPITHLVGERLVRGDIEGAVKCYVCTPSSDESRDKEAAECRKNLSESDDWASLRPRFHEFREGHGPAHGGESRGLDGCDSRHAYQSADDVRPCLPVISFQHHAEQEDRERTPDEPPGRRGCGRTHECRHDPVA